MAVGLTNRIPLTCRNDVSITDAETLKRPSALSSSYLPFSSNYLWRPRMAGFSDTVRAVMYHPEGDYSILRSWAKICPLLAALVAPITSLLDIPALTVRKIHATYITGPPLVCLIPTFAATLVRQIWRSTTGFHCQHRAVCCRSGI